MSNDYRTPDQRREDFEGRLQPMRPITDEDLAASPHPTLTVGDDTTRIATPVIDLPQTPVHQRPSRRPMATPVTPPALIIKPRARRWQRWLSIAVAVWVGLSFLMPPLDLLILGVDARSGEGYATRTDSIMVLGVQPRLFRVSLLSIPRDLFVNVPLYGARRVNTVNLLGELEEEGTGPALLRDALDETFGFRTDRYVRLNFTAFEALVDSVGGLRINVPKPIVDYQYPTENYGTMTVRFDAGWQHMDGETALIYARTRHADDDYGRAERQQQVVQALALKMLNPFNTASAFVAVNRHVDTNMNPLEMVLYAPSSLFGMVRFNRLVIDRDTILPGAQGAIPNLEKLSPWIDPRFN